ncbi:MAG: hypothetical protein MUE68_05140 [Bacteroidetes bacterium]|jgi:hypothetical protein|nr:hypothetical protein [Bacteroidota bacterium]MCU0453021.1 hypothetical protein [Bacteroidota bacterium]
MANSSTIFLSLFGGVFLLAGLAMLISGLGDIGVAENDDQWVLVVMGIIFAAAGGAVIAAGFRHGAEVKAIEAAKQRHPSEPWMWERTWTSRRIEHDAGSTTVALWAFALIWNAIVITAGILGWEEMAAQVSEEPAVLFVLLFPVVGIGVFIAAVRSTMQWRRFGTSALVLRRIPVALGRDFTGTLELPADVREADEIMVSLRCLRTTKSGKNTSTAVIWSDEQRYPRTLIGSGPSGPTLAVSFRVPADEPETSVGSGYPSIRWELNVSAAVAGVDFGASYRLPVFRTHDTHEPGASSEEAPSPRAERAFGVVERTIVRQRGADGSSVWHYPPLRAPSAAVFLTGFTIVWSVVVYFLASSDAPGIFTALFGFFEILLIMGTVDVLLGRVTVTIDRRGMSVLGGPGFSMNTRVVPLADVQQFRVKGGMTVGSTVYHSIEASLANGKTVTVGKYLRSRAEAEEIVEEMEEELKRG